MKIKNGFTLIELLAVIVILAIIALIATPIVLDIINDTKTNASLRSGEFYVDAVEQAITKHMMTDATFKAKECMIKKDGNLLCSELGFNVCEERNAEIVCSGKETEVKIEVSGEKPTEGIIELDKGKVEDVKLVLGNNSLVMKENSLVFENDAEVIYETDIVAGSQVNIPDDFDYNTIYNVSFTNPDLGIDEKQRGILSEENGNKYLIFESYLGTMTELPFNIPASPYTGHLKIEKTSQKLDNYALRITSNEILFYSSDFELGAVKFYYINGNEKIEIKPPSAASSLPKFSYKVGNYAVECFPITDIYYNYLEQGIYFYVEVVQEIDGNTIIRRYGGTKPKYQETHAYSEVNDSYYWGTSDFFPFSGD